MRDYKELFQFQSSRNSHSPQCREIILIGTADKFNEAVFAQSSNDSGNLGGIFVEHVSSNVFVLETADSILTTGDGQKDMEVVRMKEIEAPE